MSTAANITTEFKKDYDKLFLEYPEAANLFLLIYELSDKKGVCTLKGGETELTLLFNKRFKKPQEYQLSEY